MKTLKLSSIALCIFALVSSCTKDSLETSTASSSSYESVLGSSRNGGTETQSTGSGNGQNNNQDNGNNDNSSSNGNEKTTATVNYTISPLTAEVTDNVTISGTINFAAAVDQFVYGVDVLKKDATGSWAAFTVTGLTDNVNLTTGTITSKDFSFSFLASTWGPGEYKISIHVAGQDVHNMFSDVKTLVINRPCEFSLTGVVTSAVPAAEAGKYQFTVQYTVETCDLHFNMLKTQGGLTNGIVLVSSEGGVDRQPGNSTNKVITWTEGSKGGAERPAGDRTYTVIFTKAWDGVSEIELTGDWSVTASLMDGTEKKATFSKIYYPL